MLTGLLFLKFLSYTRNVMVTRDLAKFYHPDAVLEDAYIFR